MKRVVFAPIIDSYRGSLTGAQSLLYARDYNDAWYSPSGRKNAARNYHANYIAKVSAKSGEPYIVIRKKSSINMSDKMIKQMAVQGAASAVFNSLLKSNQYNQSMAMYLRMIEIGSIPAEWSYRKYWWESIWTMLMQGSATMVLTSGTISVTLSNPWRLHYGTITTPVSNRILSKFWLQLAGDAAKIFQVEDRGIYKSMLWDGVDSWSDVLASNYNILGFSEGQSGSIMLGDKYVNAIVGGEEITMDGAMSPREGMFTSDDYIH